jgi:dipeptidase D
VIGDKIPGIQMISFGPDIRGAHTPQEKVKIDSVARVWNFLLTLLAQA